MSDETEVKLRERMKECDELRGDLNAAQGLIERLSELLVDTASALKGEPEADTAHSWHDLPEVARLIVADAKSLRDALKLTANVAFYPHPNERQSTVETAEASYAAGLAMGRHDAIFRGYK